MADVTVGPMQNFPPQNIPDTLDGTVLTVVNGDLGNANTSYLYFDLVKTGFNVFSMQFVIQATTLTIEASNSAPSVDNASAVWTDISDLFTDSSGTPIVNITATGSLTAKLPLPFSRLRIKRVTTNAVNALTIVLTRGRVR